MESPHDLRFVKVDQETLIEFLGNAKKRIVIAKAGYTCCEAETLVDLAAEKGKLEAITVSLFGPEISGVIPPFRLIAWMRCVIFGKNEIAGAGYRVIRRFFSERGMNIRQDRGEEQKKENLYPMPYHHRFLVAYHSDSSLI